MTIQELMQNPVIATYVPQTLDMYLKDRDIGYIGNDVLKESVLRSASFCGFFAGMHKELSQISGPLPKIPGLRFNGHKEYNDSVDHFNEGYMQAIILLAKNKADK